MRTLFLMLALIVGFCGIAFAQVEGRILKVDQDERGAIRVYTSYSVDGVEVKPCNYPDKIDGHDYCVFRMSIQNVEGGLDPLKIQVFVDKQIQQFSEHLIAKPISEGLQAQAKLAQDLLAESQAIKSLVGREVRTEEAVLIADTNFDGKQDKKLTCNTHGVVSEEDYIPSDIVITP